MSDSSHDDRLVDLARRLLDGEAIDWEKEGIAEAEVREGMKRLEQVIGRKDQTETADAPRPSSFDRFIGTFRIVRKLGEGGMGVVYEAEQQHPKRPVALKVIRGGHHVDEHALRLFQREIQTLARLSHPGIAQLYETGATDDGMHYFAMELIRGVPLSEWLKKRNDGPVTPPEMKIRLGVFRKICDAVAYAHQRGVVHRDLKPGNILIPTVRAGASMADAIPEVKILDFGLARMTDTDVQMTTFVTEMGRVQGTLPYMSPEQVRGNPDEIDVRTDVYSLGVILYEMVTGHLPYDLSKVQLPDAVRIICEETPRSLSATFTGTKRLAADVGTIAGKCLEKETARRYQSAAALSEDIQRYLSDQPILARPPSAAYQFRKLVSRHKGPFAAATGAFVLLLVFSIAMSVQAVRIAKERDRANLERDRANQEAETARRVSEFLEGLFTVSDPWAARDKEVSPRELLDAGAERIDLELKDQPKIQARLMKTMAIAYRGLGLVGEGATFLERAVKLTEAAFGVESLEYADVLSESAPNDVAIQVRAHEIRLRILKPDEPAMARSLCWVGTAQMGNRLPQAEGVLKQALASLEAAKSSDEELHVMILMNLGACLQLRGDYLGAGSCCRRALQIAQRALHERHPLRGLALNNLGFYLLRRGERQEARGYLQTALDANERRLGSDHPQVGINLASLGELERLEGHLDRARPLLNRSLQIFDKSRFDPLDSIYIDSLASLGRLAETEGDVEDALRHLRRACEIYAREPGFAAEDPSLDYARVLRKAGRIAEAEIVETSLRFEGAKP